MMKNFANLLIYFVLFTLINRVVECEISDKRLCADPECKTLISLARTLVRYQSVEEGVLSFPINKEVRVYSKAAGSNSDLWGVEIQGQRGYANKKLLREYRIYIKNSNVTYEVPTELNKLRQKKIDEEQAKLKGSEPEQPNIEVTTTAPLTEQAEKIVTDGGENGANQEVPIIQPVHIKKEVIDGTTVLIPDLEPVDREPSVPGESEQTAEIAPKEETIIEATTEKSIRIEVPESVEEEEEEEEIIAESDEDDDDGSEDVDEEEEGEKASEKPIDAVTTVNKSPDIVTEETPKKLNEDEVPPFKPVPEDTSQFIEDALSVDNATADAANENSVNEIEPEISAPDTANIVKNASEEKISENPTIDMPPVDEPTTLNAEENTTVPSFPEEVATITPSESNELVSPEAEPVVVASNTVTSQEPYHNDHSHEHLHGFYHQHHAHVMENNLPPLQQYTTTPTYDEHYVPNPLHDETTPNPLPSVVNITDTIHETVSDALPALNESESYVEPISSILQQQQESAEILSISTEKLQESVVEEQTELPSSFEQAIPAAELVTEDLKSEPVIEQANTDESSQKTSSEGSNQQQEAKEEANQQPPIVDVANEQQPVVQEETQQPALPIEDKTNQQQQQPNVPEPTQQPLTEADPYEPPVVAEPSTEETQTTPLPSIAVSDESTQPTPVDTSAEPAAPTAVETKGLFNTILETVNGFWSSSKLPAGENQVNENFDQALEKLLFPGKESPTGAEEESSNEAKVDDENFCENLSPDACPSSSKFARQWNDPHQHHDNDHPPTSSYSRQCSCEDDYIVLASKKLYEMTDLIVCLSITALTLLIFTLGYYCTSSKRKEYKLVSKLNIVERSLLASNKESAILKQDLSETLNKLTSIEDNSFGSNDMVIALKHELDESEMDKEKLRDQVVSLEKELENAAEAGLELNKMVSELLSNQSGDDSIISSVEELQKQLNEQQNTILEINTTLAEKSRENSELQMLIAELNAKFQEEIEQLKIDNEALTNERNSLQSQADDAKNHLETELDKVVSQKAAQLEKLEKDLAKQVARYDELLRKYLASEAKVETLEEGFDSIKKNPNINMKEFLKASDNKTELLSMRKERDSLKERLEGEAEARKLLEDHVKIVSEEVSTLKQEYTQAEKEKLEAQTRLEVLSNYFKEKETQLQKELSVKEAMWMKQQGETISTVERVRLIQDEIQALKSQNDSLRAEIEAQAAAHKAQITSLENRSHETWLAARQTERKLEEARSEATALRRKLTAIATNSLPNDALQKLPNIVDGLTNHDLNQAPSPIHMESPASPLLGGLPPPPVPPFLPPPFGMGHHHHHPPPPPPFMSMPPPFMPPGEMRPPPLGRLMSPPPLTHSNRYSPSLVDDERNRYSPENGRYTPDNRYNYNNDMNSTYDTETDFSPPPSPHGRSRGGGGSGNGGNGGGGGGGSGDRDSGGYSSRERDRNHRERERSGNNRTGDYREHHQRNSDRTKNKQIKGSCYSDSDDDNGSDW